MNILFSLHYIGIFIIHFGWVLYPSVLYCHIPIAMSWYMNSNNCLLSQLEWAIFGQTFLGHGPVFYVPPFHRHLLYANFCLGACTQLTKHFFSI